MQLPTWSKRKREFPIFSILLQDMAGIEFLFGAEIWYEGKHSSWPYGYCCMDFLLNVAGISGTRNKCTLSKPGSSHKLNRDIFLETTFMGKFPRNQRSNSFVFVAMSVWQDCNEKDSTNKFEFLWVISEAEIRLFFEACYSVTRGISIMISFQGISDKHDYLFLCLLLLYLYIFLMKIATVVITKNPSAFSLLAFTISK